MKIICSLPKPVGHCRNKRLIVVNIYPEKEKNTSQTSIISASRRRKRRREQPGEEREEWKEGERGRHEKHRTETSQIEKRK